MRNPGFHRLRVGDTLVTALCDGEIEVALDNLVGLAPGEAEALRALGFRQGSPMLTVSAFAITSAETTALIDAGGSSKLDPGLGDLKDNLALSGLSPDRISAVLLTHLHSDHFGGLIDENGAAVYPNAALVIPAAERGHRLEPPGLEALSAARREGVEDARRAVAPYRDRLRFVEPGAAYPGVEAIPLPGHTPGHTGWRISSRGESLLIWGDVIHFPEIQFPRPEVGMIFDVGRALAIQTRRELLARCANERSLIAGMHLDFPCFGRVAAEGAGYRFAPERFRQAV